MDVLKPQEKAPALFPNKRGLSQKIMEDFCDFCQRQHVALCQLLVVREDLVYFHF